MARLKSSSVILRKFFIAQLNAFGIGHNPDLRHRVHIHADEVLRGNVPLGFDVNGDLADDELIHTLQERDLHACAADQHLRVLAKAGNNVCYVGGALT